jgi:hypothetical protein
MSGSSNDHLAPITTQAQRAENRSVIDVLIGGALGIAVAWCVPAAMSAAAEPSRLAAPVLGLALALLAAALCVVSAYAAQVITVAGVVPLLYGTASLILAAVTGETAFLSSPPLAQSIALVITGGALIGSGVATRIIKAAAYQESAPKSSAL